MDEMKECMTYGVACIRYAYEISKKTRQSIAVSVWGSRSCVIIIIF